MLEYMKNKMRGKKINSWRQRDNYRSHEQIHQVIIKKQNEKKKKKKYVSPSAEKEEKKYINQK